MTTKKPKAGGEIDAYCTRCKLDLAHRVIAMVGEAVKKVECKTCGSHHNYRRPKSEPEAPKATGGVGPFRRGSEPPPAKAPKAPSKPRTSRAMSERVSAAALKEKELTQLWERAVAGKAVTAFQAYRTTSTFGGGELIHHPKFGDGFIYRIIDRGKVEILFQDGARTMAHGQA